MYNDLTKGNLITIIISLIATIVSYLCAVYLIPMITSDEQVQLFFTTIVSTIGAAFLVNFLWEIFAKKRFAESIFEAAQFLAMPKKTRGAIIDAFCTRIEARGYKPMLYSSKYWLSALIPSETTRRWDVWLAQYAPRPTYSGDFTMWQRGTGKVDGIAGRVDIDICYRDYVDESPDRIVFALTSPMMQGKPVSALQAMLNAAGYTASDGQRLNVDGKLGKRSFSAFVEFLNAHKKYIE